MRSTQNIVVFVVCSLLSAATVLSQSDAPALGLISQVTGQVFIERGTTKTAARLADMLYSGDKVTVADGQAVFLFCPSSSKFTILKNTSVELRANDLRTLKGKPPAAASARCLLPRTALGKESMERLGALRARNEVPVAVYLGGAITSARPAFRWASVPGTENYRLTLTDVGRDAAVWQTTTTSPGAAYPESTPPLAETQYEWEVLAVAGGKTLARGMASFEVKSNPALSQVADATSEAKLLRAISLENEGYYAEAAFYYRELRDASPDDARLTRHLAWLYWNAGLIVAANDELRRLAAQPEE